MNPTGHGAGRLWPTDLRSRADAERWMDWTYAFQRELQRPLFWALVRTPPEKRDRAAIEAAPKTCAELLKIPERYLAEQPALEAWFERLCRRPAFRNIVDLPLS